MSQRILSRPQGYHTFQALVHCKLHNFINLHMLIRPEICGRPQEQLVESN